MKPIEPNSPETSSADLVGSNLEAMQQLFPEAFTEGRIDFEVLKQLLGGAVDEREEKYGLNWHGKRQARQLALTPSTGTLRPAPQDSVDWDTTQNLMIEGDNLEVLKLLQKSYAGKVKMIYIDPPYNTGKDFVYKDDFKASIENYRRITDQVDAGGYQISTNSETSGRFHTDWLTMIYPRLLLANTLLHPDGTIFISIDDSELANLFEISTQVFGEECYVGCVSRRTGTPTGGGNASLVNELDYVLIFSKSLDVKISGLEMNEEDAAIYGQEDEAGKYLTRSLRRTGGEDRREDRPSMYYAIQAPNGRDIYPIAPEGYESRWRCGEKKYQQLLADGMIEWREVQKADVLLWTPYQKFYLEGRKKQPSNLWDELEGNKKATRELKELLGQKGVFDNPKPVALINHILELTDFAQADIVLDFFAGSGTTAHAVLAYNASQGTELRYIAVQLPMALDPENKLQKVAANYCEEHGLKKNIAELTKERIRRASTKIKAENPLFHGDLGFRVFKLDSTNIRPWEPNRDKLTETLEESVEHIKTGRSEQDVLYEVLLKLGLELTVPIETRTIAGKTVHSVGAGTLLVCLAENITATEVEPLALGMVAWHKELAPAVESTVVFRDSAFADDVAKTNLTAILTQHGLENVRSL